MDDKLSIKSSDSVTTSGEYEIVPEESEIQSTTQPLGTSPTLKIANNGNFNDLEKNLTEVIHELDDTTTVNDNMETTLTGQSHNQTDSRHSAKINDEIKAKNVVDDSSPLETAITQTNSPSVGAEKQIEMARVGKSVFYDCLEISPTAEKQDFMKTEQSDTDEEMSDIDQDCTEFAGVTYLGSVKINAPKSENEILRNINEMNSHTHSNGLKVSVSIPSCSEGFVVLHDSETNAIIYRYEVSRIIFYFRGPAGSPDQACFAFTFQTGESNELNPLFQCYIFRCNIPEAVNQVSSCFAKAFQRPISASMTASVASGVGDNNNVNVMTSSILSDVSGNPINSAAYEFIVSLQIREKMAKTSYNAVPRDRSGFKLRCNTDKELTITVNQMPPPNLPTLFIERCFGVLLNAGKLIRQADMQLLDMVQTMGYTETEHQLTKNQTSVNPTPDSPFVIKAEFKASDKNFQQLNIEASKLSITVAVDLVIRGIQEPVRFIIETGVSIQSQNEMRLMDVFSTKKSISQRFYLQLKDSGDGGWEVGSIDPSDEIVEPATSAYAQPSSILKNWGFKLTRSTSTISMEQDESPLDYSSDGDEPLLSGTGDVPKDCPQDILEEWAPIMAHDWDDKRPKNLSAMVRNGIPEKLRDKMWQKLANVENKTEIINKYRLLLSGETNCENVIQRDINRTFPANKVFKEIGGSGQDALFKVCKAYAVYDTEVGYCQGLTYIAASLLLHMPEEEAFCVLVTLMFDFGLRDLYKDGFEMLYLHLYQLNRLIKDQLPKLYEHFEQNGVETHMFASQWFLTLFNARFPLYFVFHILDVFLLDGMQILFQVALTLLNEFESELRMLDFEGILKYFRVTLPKRCRSTTLARKLMKKACERKVKKLKQYREEFLAQKEMAERKEAAMKEYELRFDEERTKYRTEILLLQTKLRQSEDKNRLEEERNKKIIDDYKQIIQRQEQQMVKVNDILSTLSNKVSKCTTCSADEVDSSSEQSDKSDKAISKQPINNLGPLDPLEIALKQIKELELGLAQTKLDLVESQCRNQDLTHQMNTLIAEIQSNRNSWQPWLAKTINTIQEKVASSKRDNTPTFQSYTSQSTPTSNNSLEQNQISPSMRPKTLPSPLSGRLSLDFSKMDSPTSPTNATGNMNHK